MVFEQYQYNARGDYLKTTFMVSGTLLRTFTKTTFMVSRAKKPNLLKLLLWC